MGATSSASLKVVSLSTDKGTVLFSCAGCAGAGVFVDAGIGGGVATGNAGVKGGWAGATETRNVLGVAVGVKVGRLVASGNPLT